MRYTFTLYSIKVGFLCAAVNPRMNLKLLVMVGQKFVMVGQEIVMVGQIPAHAHPWLRHWLNVTGSAKKDIIAQA